MRVSGEKKSNQKTYVHIVFVHREELMLHQITDGKHFMQLIFGTNNKLLDCEYVKEPKATKDFVREFWKEEQGKNNTVDSLSEKFTKMIDFQHLKNVCHKNHEKTRKRLANRPQRRKQYTAIEGSVQYYTTCVLFSLIIVY